MKFAKSFDNERKRGKKIKIFPNEAEAKEVAKRMKRIFAEENCAFDTNKD